MEKEMEKEKNMIGKLKFEGEYLNGEKNGRGIEYNFDGILEFEGDYENDKKMGKEKNIMKKINYYLKENI